MIAVGHSSIGILIGVGIVAVSAPSSPGWAVAALAFVLAAGLHYACDFIPHGHYCIDDKHLTIRSVGTLFVDFIIGALLLVWLAWGKYGLSAELVVIAAAMFGSLAPDMFETLIKLKFIPKTAVVRQEMALHEAVHWHDEPSSPLPHGARPMRPTDVWQLVAFVLAIYVLIY